MTDTNDQATPQHGMNALTAPDWIALRLLYLMMSSDPSVVELPDVQKTLKYYEDLCRHPADTMQSTGAVQAAFACLNLEIPYDGKTFGAPGVKLTRYVKLKEPE